MPRTVHYLITIIVLSIMANSGLAQETPCSNEGEIIPLGEGQYTDFVETNSTDPNWVLVTSNVILRANLCEPTSWYDNVFNPCGYYTIRYWKLPPGANTGRAFPIETIQSGTTDSFYVREGWIEGKYYSNDAPFSFSFYTQESYPHINIIPEPTTFFFLAIGMVGVRAKCA